MSRLMKELQATTALSIVIGGEWRIADAIAKQAWFPPEAVAFDPATKDGVVYYLSLIHI